MFDSFIGISALLILISLLFTYATGDILSLCLVGFTIYCFFAIARGFS